jgi:hypothetical protein
MRARKLGGAVSGYLRRNALACVALFFALSGGVAWATHPGGANTISSADIINGQVNTVDLANAAVKAGKLASDSVGTTKVVDDSLRGDDVLDDSLAATDLATGAVGSAEVADGSLVADDYAYAHGTTAVDLGSVAGQSCGSSELISVPAGASNDPVVVTPSDSWIGVQTAMTYNTRLVGGIFNAFRIQICNITSSAIDPPSITFHWVMLDRP